jgi:hypothetical protein
MVLSENIIRFNRQLHIPHSLPKNIMAFNPFKNDANALRAMEQFYRKFYNDNFQRIFMIGINPGRFGAAVTGIPFTDSKRLIANCGIDFKGKITHEPSSVFVYEVIEAFGGVENFYKHFYINSIVPLGFAKLSSNNKWLNYNYYDDIDLKNTLKPFIVQSIRKQLKFGLHTHTVFCLGSGKNYDYLNQLNEQYRFFQKIIPLEHPRFIMQYKHSEKQVYVEKYSTLLQQVVKELV